MSDDKLIVTPGAASIAAFFLTSALMMRLAEKNVISIDEANEIAATGASLCRGNGEEMAAKMIEETFPTAVGVDSVKAAEARGHKIVHDEG